MRRFILRVLSLFRRDRAEDDLAREVSSHLALLEDEYQRRGLSDEEARYAARRAMGSVTLAQDRQRDARSFAWLDDLRRDTRHALRNLLRTPGFAVVAIVTLGLGIGVNNTFFTIVNAICLRGVPIDEPERVLFIGVRDAQNRPGGMSYLEFKDLQSSTHQLSGVGAFSNAPMTIADEGRAPDRFMGAFISASAFGLVGDVPMLGRSVQPDDDRPGAPPVVMLGAGVWHSRYAGDPSLIGRTVIVNGTPSTVIGVMPEGFKFPGNTDIWQPLVRMPGISSQARDVRLLFVFGRLAPEATFDQARAEIETIGATWARAFPESSRRLGTTAVPINQQLNGQITDRTWLAFITAGALVLLIACANVANLLLMRGATRGREMAIRASIGATRGRLVRQLLIESALLAVLSGTVGIVFSLAGLRLLSAMVPPEGLQYWMTFTIDGRVLTMLLAVCLGSVFVFGLAPALHLMRVDVNTIIKDTSRTAAGVPARRWMTAFLVVEFALSLVLLAAVVAGVRQQLRDQRAEFPLNPAPLLSMWVTLPGQPYETAEKRIAFFDRLTERFAAVPGVTSVAMASMMPRISAPTMRLEIAEHPTVTADSSTTVVVVGASDEYFHTLGMPLTRGREFTPLDGRPGQESAIVNQRFVEMFLGRADPIGRLIRVSRLGTNAEVPWSRIVGVSPTIRQRAGGVHPDPVVYLPLRANPSPTVAIMVRATGDANALTPGLREELRRLDPHLPFYRLMTLDRAISEAQWNGRMANVLILSICGIALLMALVGLYAVTAHAVHRWRSELGVRIAFGARPRGVAWLVMRRTLTQLAMGLVVGVACAYAFDRLFTVAGAIRLTDSLVLLPLMMSMTIVAVVACIIPIRRAAYVDPVEALRTE